MSLFVLSVLFKFCSRNGHWEVLLEIDFVFENEKFSCIGREGLLRKAGTELILISLLQRLMSISFRMAGRGANYRPKRVDNHCGVSLMEDGYQNMDLKNRPAKVGFSR